MNGIINLPCDADGIRLRGSSVNILNDYLYVSLENGYIYKYSLNDLKLKEKVELFPSYLNVVERKDLLIDSVSKTVSVETIADVEIVSYLHSKDLGWYGIRKNGVKLIDLRASVFGVRVIFNNFYIITNGKMSKYVLDEFGLLQKTKELSSDIFNNLYGIDIGGGESLTFVNDLNYFAWLNGSQITVYSIADFENNALPSVVTVDYVSSLLLQGQTIESIIQNSVLSQYLKISDIVDKNIALKSELPDMSLYAKSTDLIQNTEMSGSITMINDDLVKAIKALTVIISDRG